MLLVADSAPENKLVGLAAVAVLGIGMFSVVVKPNAITVLLCWTSVLLWLALGVLGAGINC
jgi:NADH:ubiquinone oxidoreductase subunit K